RDNYRENKERLMYTNTTHPDQNSNANNDLDYNSLMATGLPDLQNPKPPTGAELADILIAEIAKGTVSLDQDWTLDTAAIQHFTGNRTWFSEFKEVAPKNIRTAGQPVVCTAIGSIITQLPTCDQTITLSN